MTTTHQAPLVGMHFRMQWSQYSPACPAKALLTALPGDCPLELELEPSNAYDPNAIAVWLDPANIPTSQHDNLRELLPTFGFELEEILAGKRWHIGYLKATAAAELAPLLRTATHSEAHLGFASDSKPFVNVTIGATPNAH